MLVAGVGCAVAGASAIACCASSGFVSPPSAAGPESAPASLAYSRHKLLRAGFLALGLAAPSPATALSPQEVVATQLFQRTTPSVVSISETLLLTSYGKERTETMVGSGFVWDSHHVVTTASMLKGSKRPLVTVVDTDETGEERKRVLNAAVVGKDAVNDVAVLWVDGEMRPVHRGSSEDLRVGQQVYALGNPFGLEHSMSKGVVSGLRRTVTGASGRPIIGAVQVDCSINPGNNGGPLLDADGKVVGVNYGLFRERGFLGSVGLAIPIEAVEHSVTGIILTGHVISPSLGIVFGTDALSRQLGLTGLMIRGVSAGSPAAQAGLRPMKAGRLGDIINGVDGRPVGSTGEFFIALGGKRPGEEVMLSVQRGAADDADSVDTVDIKVRLG